ncbi:MAG: intradiol ring-cleavage dioxygenase [Pseudomonadota bacterium]
MNEAAHNGFKTAAEKGYFTEEESAEVVIARNSGDENQRLKEVMAVFTRHIHAAVKEIEPTPEEWFQAIQFLTNTGHMCDDWRQEFILLSDVLGVSMLVDAINARRPEGATENTVLGPFHLPDAPVMENGGNICRDEKGEPMVVQGTVKDIDGNPVQGARLDIWQANDDGFYDVQQKGIQPDFNLRGVFESQEDGSYWFRGVKPKYYPIPHDGPVGQLLAGLGRDPNRPAHIHYIITADGYEEVITHIFDPDDPYINSDAVFGVKESLLGTFNRVDDAKRAEELGVPNPFWNVEFNVVLTPKK